MKHILLLTVLLLAPLAAAASGEPLIYQASPDMAQEYHAQATAGALELAGDPAIKPANAPSLKITARDATGYVGSGRFTLKGDRESDFGTVYARARFFIKTSPDFRGSYDVRIFVPDAKTPENSFSVPLRHFKPQAEDGSVVNGFQLTHKELCVISMGNPNQLWKGTTIQVEGCEVRVYLETASGTLWMSDVAIGRARPSWSNESWEQFEQAAGEQIILSQGNLIQPMYERSLDYASPEVMDTVHKLLRVSGFNAVSEWIGWSDDFGRCNFDAIFRVEASNAPTPGGGNADYAASLDQLAAHVDNARYYGLQVGIMLQGTPDWTHPGRYNNRTPHSDFQDPLHNPGSATNGLSDPYPGPQVFKFESDQSIRAPRNYCQYPPDHWSDWEDLARALVTRLKGKVLYYEIGNEVDAQDQGCPVGGYLTVLEFLRRFHGVARRIDPQAVVVSPDASWSPMLPAMIANGMANYCDWYGFHSYHETEGYERVRRVVEAGGVRKHLMATEGPMLREAWIGKLRGQSLWTACSLMPDNSTNPEYPLMHLVYLKNAQGNRTVAADPKGSGDRVDWKEGLYDWGYASGKLDRGNLDGASKVDRIHVTVPARVTVAASGSATVVLTATNKSSTTYTNVRLWPIGFVDALGFDRESLRASDRTIPAFRPGQTEEVQMQVKPRGGRAFPARGIYRIGMAVINDEGRYSLASGDLEVVNSVTTGATTRLSNLAVRTALVADQTLFLGFSVNGGSRPILMRGVGPTLARFGISGVMADPRLELYNGAARVAENDDWGNNPALGAAFSSVGAFALVANSKDAALLQSVDGTRTVQLKGAGAGVVLVELYDTGSGGTARLGNVSARNQAGTGDKSLILGFFIEGSGSKNLLIRAIGPRLSDLGVAGAMADPKFAVFRAGSTVPIAGNDNWDAALAPTFSAVGAFGLIPGSRDAALATTLSGGSYTVQVSGVNDAAGVALVEVYELP